MKNSIFAGPRKLYFISVALAILFLFTILQTWKLTIDDAYITGRYARNAALGNGLVYNIKERVMGYTNLLLTLVETAIFKLNGNGIFIAKIIGLVCGVLILLLTIYFFKLIGQETSKTPGYLAALLLIAYPYLAINSVNGLETSLFSFLLLVSIILFLKGWIASTWSVSLQTAMAITLFLATLARPEAFGYAIIILLLQVAGWIYQRIQKNTGPINRLFAQLVWIVEYIILLVPVLVALHAYYGSFLPNTFLAKTAAGLSFDKYRTGLMYVISWFYDIGGLFLFVPLMLYPFLNRSKNKLFWLLLSFFGVQILYIIYTGGDWMPGFRFLVPLMPLFFLAIAMGLDQIWQVLSSRFDSFTPLSRNILAIILITIIVSYGIYQSVYQYRQEEALAQAEIDGHAYIGNWLIANTYPSDTIALMDIGRIGFISNRYIIDITGLVNRDVAKLMHQDIGSITSTWPTAQKIASYVLSQKPDYIILNHVSAPGTLPFVGRTHDVAIFSADEFKNSYEFLFTQPYMQEYQSIYKRISP